MPSLCHHCLITVPSQGAITVLPSSLFYAWQVHFTEIIDGQYLMLDAPKLLPGNKTLAQMALEAIGLLHVPPAKWAGMELQVEHNKALHRILTTVSS